MPLYFRSIILTMADRMIRNHHPQYKKKEESNNSNDNYHMVFSTSCSPFQNWQSHVLFYSAMRIHQPGHVTRIASGCSPEEGEALQQEFASSVAPMSPNNKFHLHLSPEFRNLAPENHNMSKQFAVTKYFNKPFGLLHWMEQEMKYNEGGSTSMDTILILVDPDMILLRPITGDYIDDESMVWEDPSLNSKNERNKGVRGTKVEHGNPLGSRYGYGAIPFQKFDLLKIIPDKNSPVHGINRKDGAMYYPAGPPYIATARDMYDITKMWTTVSPKVHEQSQEMMAEMYSYSIAAAHLGLPHQLSKSFMVSVPNDLGRTEGWDMIDQIEPSKICHYDTESGQHKLPLVLHYCQRALLERWVITKYRLRKDLMSCEAPLLEEPPADLAMKYNYGITPPKKKGEPEGDKIEYRSQQIVQHHAFMLCQEIFTFNRAFTYYKEQNCFDGNGKVRANFNKTYSAFPDPAF